MPINEPSGASITSPKIRDQSIVRRFVSQGGLGYLAIMITPDGKTAVDPDPGTLTLNVYFLDPTLEFPASSDPNGVLVLTVDSAAITRTDTGMYTYSLGTVLTQNRGVLTAIWSYTVNGQPFTYSDYLQILNPMPTYDGLDASSKLMVDQVTFMLGDLFDSTTGGPYLIEPFQTHFDSERLAQLLQIAIIRFNFTGNPPTNYGLNAETNVYIAPASQFTQLCTLGLYLEVVRHLVRSYIEIPDFVGVNVTYEDRRQYSDKWQRVLDEEWPEYKASVIMAKRSLLGLSRGSLLVAGGIYGGSAGIFQAGTYAAQVRSMRFYPAAPAISWGATAH